MTSSIRDSGPCRPLTLAPGLAVGGGQVCQCIILTSLNTSCFMFQIAPGTRGCPCPCLTGVEMTLRVRGCRSGQPCPSEPAQLPSPALRPSANTSIASHACHPQSDSYLAVAATSYTRLRRTSSHGRAGNASLGPVLPSSHLLDHLACQAGGSARVTIAATPPAGDPDTLAVPRAEVGRSRSLREGGGLPGPGHSSSWARKGKQWSLPPKRPGRFSSRRNRCNTGSTLAPPAFNRPARPSSSHPDFREFRF